MGGVSCAKNHDIERRRAVVKLPRAREKEREEDTVCSVVHIIVSRDVISEIHTRDTQVSYVTNDLQFLKRTHEKDGHTVTRMPSICHDLESRPFFLWPNLPKLFCLPAVFQFRLWRPRRPPHGSSRRTLGRGGEAGGAPREGKVRNIAI